MENPDEEGLIRRETGGTLQGFATILDESFGQGAFIPTPKICLKYPSPPLVSGLFPQVRSSLRVLRPWHPSLRRRKAGAGERLSPGLLLLRNLREEAGHRGRVLPHGGQEAAMQAGLRGRQDEG